jgi:hypothetical protein
MTRSARARSFTLANDSRERLVSFGLRAQKEKSDERRGVTLLLGELGANRRVVVRPDVGYASACAVLVDLDQVADFREFTRRAFVLADPALPVRLNKLHVVGLHRRKLTTGAGRS